MTLVARLHSLFLNLVAGKYLFYANNLRNFIYLFFGDNGVKWSIWVKFFIRMWQSFSTFLCVCEYVFVYVFVYVLTELFAT